MYVFLNIFQSKFVYFNMYVRILEHFSVQICFLNSNILVQIHFSENL